MYFRVANSGIEIPLSCTIKPGVRIYSTDGGYIVFGSNVVVGENSLIAARGGSLVVGNNVEFGLGCVVVTLESISIGSDSLLAEYVVIRDQDHDFEQGAITDGNFKKSPIRIGESCWLGAKCTVLRGSIIGKKAIIGAHSVVNKTIESHTVACGAPARVTRAYRP